MDSTTKPQNGSDKTAFLDFLKGLQHLGIDITCQQLLETSVASAGAAKWRKEVLLYAQQGRSIGVRFCSSKNTCSESLQRLLLSYRFNEREIQIFTSNLAVI